ncbi:hypothetical protein BKA64DRAFT_453488 [Cadophora sp. MPI-SDFR-AT-0126]|nr:hypothetical protein BKA64DRAFT_453488 [Leotiomycetes sp. MPI-SDFR-AT-0126]
MSGMESAELDSGVEGDSFSHSHHSFIHPFRRWGEPTQVPCSRVFPPFLLFPGHWTGSLFHYFLLPTTPPRPITSSSHEASLAYGLERVINIGCIISTFGEMSSSFDHSHNRQPLVIVRLCFLVLQHNTVGSYMIHSYIQYASICIVISIIGRLPGGVVFHLQTGGDILRNTLRESPGSLRRSSLGWRCPRLLSLVWPPRRLALTDL